MEKGFERLMSLPHFPNFEHKHTDLAKFAEFVQKQAGFLDLRNDLAGYAGAGLGDTMSTFYADLIKACYDNFMKENVQIQWRKRWRIANNKKIEKAIKIEGVEL